MAKRATKRTTLALAILAGTASGACQGQIDGADPGADGEQARIEEYLAAKGLDPAGVVFEGDRVFLHDDFFLDREALLVRIAEHDSSPGNQTQPELVNKGYKYKFLDLLPRVVDLSFDDNVPADIRSAIRGAAFDWSSTTPCLNIKAGNGGQPIRIRYEDAGRPPPLAPGESYVQGQASPRWGATPALIVVNRRWITNEHPDSAAIAAMAIHEMGHTLGFAHPAGGQTHIHGTNTYKKVCDANVRPSYPTVMDYCGGEFHPTADDRKSVRYVYGDAAGCLN